MWVKVVIGTFSGQMGNPMGGAWRLRQVQNEIRREFAARVCWKMISDFRGKALPEGRHWEFTHCAAEMKKRDPHWTPTHVVDAEDVEVTEDQRQ